MLALSSWTANHAAENTSSSELYVTVYSAAFEVLKEVLMEIQVFWDVMSSRWVRRRYIPPKYRKPKIH
jgi:hypothetical protein